MSALGGIVQLKSIAIVERPVWRLHWSAFSSQRECVWQLNQSVSRKWRSGLNRIGHPDWVKLSVELNCAPNQNTKFLFTTDGQNIYSIKLPFFLMQALILKITFAWEHFSLQKEVFSVCSYTIIWFSSLFSLHKSYALFSSLRNKQDTLLF